METSKLKKFAQYARRSLIDQVGSKLEQVIKEESQARRELPEVIDKLDKELESKSKEQLVEQVAYVWFNRFCALRFMDVNAYNRIGVLSPIEGQFQPEILAEAKAGHIDEAIVNEQTREKIFGLLNGSIKTRDGQAEAYRLLIVAVCNDYHRIMPYLFERIDAYSELLMPDDLLSGNSILAYTREAMTPEACESVECIGWLYQFYISEKKDQVFERLKKNKKITPENIPAATQLFTPHWIVRYLVENSLGRLWMLNNPSSKVIEQMDFYIKPVEIETDFLKVSSPEEIKICDPACGSGHMLTYAYDLLYAIYLDASYDPTDIPELILTNNLYGIEIDERAAELAAFALSMKAIKGNPQDDSNNRRRFFRNPIKPNICRLEKITFSEQELDNYIDFVGKDLFTQDLRTTLKEFEEADNFGSLIQPTLKNAEDVLEVLKAKDVSGQLFLSETHKSVLRVLKQTDYLSQKYHVVIANPPYMGGKGMNSSLAKWVKKKYPNSKSDLFAVFIERDLKFALNGGYSGMINMQSWMFLSSFEKLREWMLGNSTILSMAHLGTRAFSSIGGEVVSTTAYVLKKSIAKSYKGVYIKLTEASSEIEKKRIYISAIMNPDGEYYHESSSNDFEKISGSPIAYWISDKVRSVISGGAKMEDIVNAEVGLQTSNNGRFLRQWFEVSLDSINFNVSSSEVANESGIKWFPYNKGGGYRKWYGNQDYVVNWKNDGSEIKEYVNNKYPYLKGNIDYVIKDRGWFFKPSVSWSDITTGDTCFRMYPPGFVYDVSGMSAFCDNEIRLGLLGTCNTNFMNWMVKTLNPTIHFQAGNFRGLPYLESSIENLSIAENVEVLCDMSKEDWDGGELSWNFTKSKFDYSEKTVQLAYASLNRSWQEATRKVKCLEEENNRLFNDLYELNDEVENEVPYEKITLFGNPKYRYGVGKTDTELEGLLLADTVRDLISYAVGCMFGRYSLDKEGLMLANQGDTLENYLKQVPQPTFMPDDDNVIPLIDFEGDWFEDDISGRFKQFLKVTFGEELFPENLAFIENAIGKGKDKDIKKYFVKDFYVDHVKRYKKRPIYWMFSSPKGSFNVLIYMHRYRPDTVSVVLNDYMREFRAKLIARKESYEQIEISTSASPKEKTQAIKLVAKINKVIDEVNVYEREILYPLAGKNIEIDLDDGVKHNYPLFGKALKKVTGLS